MTDPTARDLIQRLLTVLGKDYAGTALEVEARAYLATPEPAADGPAVPESREPASVVHQPTDEEILGLSQEHGVSYTMSDGAVIYPMQQGCDMRNEVLSFARAVLEHWGR